MDFRVVLYAFVQSDVCSRFIEIWTGDTLSQLSPDEFRYFVSFYGLENLSLSSFYGSRDDGFYDDFFEEEF